MEYVMFGSLALSLIVGIFLFCLLLATIIAVAVEYISVKINDKKRCKGTKIDNSGYDTTWHSH